MTQANQFSKANALLHSYGIATENVEQEIKKVIIEDDGVADVPCSFRSEDNVRLVAFLEAADLVKFAGVTPDEEAIRQATHKARVFIELKSPESGDAA